ncbi:hypothetical protein H9X96_03100 [Pedobacter sp. N36a]|uniref:hypothetical protein n=1 Tax=Pedobacter sp. N36a TaxID=2767996 RepID=UPI001656DF87|nr:hypothetical protein [Pedobacter sp. N36a]MBC8984758.1 hypothetical protein [Pedobacter sp. N36a]
MKDNKSGPDEFDIHLDIDGADAIITVKPDETSDGARYFICYIDNDRITQLREEIDGKWEQIWGILDHDMVDAIGKEINQRHKS